MLKQISQKKAEALMNSTDLVISDIRDIDSYKEAHIENAIHLSMEKLEDFRKYTDKEKKILLYCYHGISSQFIGRHLIEQGFMEVYSLIGGYEAWKARHISYKND